ncbi:MULTISPECIES: MT-A70 family methyltransferase [unclassified Streptomyces]|uniref:MT-A70 family methyltransferase n=1 Tax=unclassified Streptomyces TaxID=2593676 RepID=UPI0033A91BE8
MTTPETTVPPLPTGPFTTIVADPPWASMHQRSTYHRGKPERHYPTMPTRDICALPISDIAAKDAHLWVWGVNRLMEDAYAVVRAWGFTPMSLLTWCKRGPGMGYYLRTNTEHCIFATRGRPMVPDVKLLSSWYEWPRARHSQKPAQFFEAVETVSPGPYLELFARQQRPGWAAWGNQVQPAPLDLFSVQDTPAAG